MNRLRTLLTLLLIVALALVAPSAYSEGPPARRPLELPTGWEQRPDADLAYEPGRVLVLYEPGASLEAQAMALSRSEAALTEQVANDLALVAVRPGEEAVVAERLRAQPGVLAAEPNYRVQALGSPNDPYFSRQWYHPLMHAPDAWDMAVGSDAVTVAVIDSGADLTHPDLAARLIAGRDYVDIPNDMVPRDAYGHGTHVAGLIGAVTNNYVGIAGADWRARLLIIRVLDQNGDGYLDDVVRGIDYAIGQGADVINLSLGSSGGASIMQPAIDRAHAAGIVVVAAMGNNASWPEAPPPLYPAACNHVIAVAATTRNDVYAYYSNWGNHVDLAAPGGETHEGATNGIYSTMPVYTVTANSALGMARNYDYWQGTSMSAALVSGLSALLLSANPALTPQQVESLMAFTAQDLGPTGWDQDYGWGRIDLARAVGQIVAPEPVRDLSITAVSTMGAGQVNVALQWTPPAHAHSISIRRSTSPITDANWVSATVVAAGLAPTTSAYTASNMPYSGGTLYFALRADGQYSPGTLWSAASNNAFWPVKIQLMLPIMRVRR